MYVNLQIQMYANLQKINTSQTNEKQPGNFNSEQTYKQFTSDVFFSPHMLALKINCWCNRKNIWKLM